MIFRIYNPAATALKLLMMALDFQDENNEEHSKETNQDGDENRGDFKDKNNDHILKKEAYPEDNDSAAAAHPTDNADESVSAPSATTNAMQAALTKEIEN